ncbi:MAG: choice-of-anchor Q domain-containing protein, partial [Tepidisphaeraceae bacterium]
MFSQLCLTWRKRLFRASLFGRCLPMRSRLPRAVNRVVELLEDRFLPSVSLNFREFHDPSRIPAGLKASALGILPQNNGTQFPVGYTPSDLQTAYGIDQIKFGSVAGDGTGQTIAIVDAYDDPAFLNSTNPQFANSDLAQFDSQLGLPDPPSFTKVNQSGQASPLPDTDPRPAGNATGNWEIEIALDIEWAHAIAPGADIVLVEATSDSDSDLYAAVATAAALPGVSAVSMSWGENEFSGETARDNTFVTPNGHQGVTFLAASGDAGGFSVDSTGNPTTTPGIDYPAASPNVVAVGGTSIQINADGTYKGETAWSGSGGGTSLYETVSAYQQGVQNTGFRTTPDVSFDADPATGVAIYDSYNDTDHSGPWVQIGGTSLAAPCWAGVIAIVNQGRVLLGGSSLDGSGQTLPILYAISQTDYHDITSGSNGVFSAGTGYDEVTGLGTPQAVALTADLSTYGTANHMAVTSQPPGTVIVGDSFGVVVAAENPEGGVDPAFNGTLTISLASNPSGATLGGTLAVTASDGVAVFDGLTLNQLGSGCTLQITSSTFPAITTNSFKVISDPTPWQGTFYPVPTDASLRAAINTADGNAFAFNTILLSASTYRVSDTSSGGLVIENSSSLPGKTLTITGQGQSSSIIGSAFNWHDRIFEIEGSGGQSLNVIMQNLTIQGGDAQDGGVLGGNDALGGGLLIDDANVRLANVAVQKNEAQGANGYTGIAGGAPGAGGAAGGAGKNARGGGIYLASGTLSLFNDTALGNAARGGKGGAGGEGGGQGTKSAAAVTGGQGGAGGQGGSAAGGDIYAAGGTVVLENDSFRSNQAVGGTGCKGGSGGSGGHGRPTEQPPAPGKPGGLGGAGDPGGAACGGAIYLAGGSLTFAATTFEANSAVGGAGGQGGAGGLGTHAGLPSKAISGGLGTASLATLSAGGGPGGDGGPGTMGGAASAGGVYVAGGSLTLLNTTLTSNQAIGGSGGLGGRGGTGGLGTGTTSLGLPIGKTGGHGGTGGHAGSGNGGGIFVAGGNVVLYAGTLNANVAQGGHGGNGGTGGNGALLALLGGAGTLTGGGGTWTSIGGGGIWTSIGGGGGGAAANSAGAGGNGGNGGTGKAGGLYISGGALTLINATVAGNRAGAGASGSGGPGGRAAVTTLTGGPGIPGSRGDAYGGGLYVSGGTVNLDNSTVALNIQTGSGSGDGAVVNSPGTVTAVSTLFGNNGAVDYSGAIAAADSLFQTTPIDGTLSGSGNLVGVDPLLNSNGLQNNGGPTPTIALQALSPAIAAGANPESLFADQRGYGPRTGPGGTDIGAYQTDAQADTQAPTATLTAAAVITGNASTLNPYTFTITYSDNVAVAAATLSDAVVQVLPPGSRAPISASFQSTVAVGTADGIGNAKSFSVTYAITPPGASWTPADDGNYTVVLGGGTVTDLAGNPVASGSLGTFSVAPFAVTTTTVTTSATGITYHSGTGTNNINGLPTFTATVTATSGGVAPTDGSVDFMDTATGQDFGNGMFVSSSGLTSTFVLSATQGATPLTWGGAAGLGANNGTAQTITAFYTGSGFSPSNGATTETVIPANLTVTGLTATKVYDGNNSFATANFSGGALSGSFAVDGLTFTPANNGTGTASSSNAGPVGVTGAGFTFAGGTLQKANYTFAQPSITLASGLATITPRAITVTAAT